MPTKSVKQDLADTITKLETLLKRDFGCDYSYHIMGRGHTLAKSAIEGRVTVKPIVEIDPATAVHRHD